MPLILSPEDAETWMTDRDAPGAERGTLTGVTDEIRTLLRPAPLETLIATPVSMRVNSVKNDDPACVATLDDRSAPVDIAQRGRLSIPVRRDLAVGETASLFSDEPPSRAPRRRAGRP